VYFTVQAPPTVQLTKLGPVHLVSITGIPHQQVVVLGRFLNQRITLNADGRATTFVLTSSPEIRYSDGTRFGPRATIITENPVIDPDTGPDNETPDNSTPAENNGKNGDEAPDSSGEHDENTVEIGEPADSGSDSAENSGSENDLASDGSDDTNGDESQPDESEAAMFSVRPYEANSGLGTNGEAARD
jgi:hypothetical protein